MFPGMGGMNPKKMQGLMKQMGISQTEIEAEKVTIEKADGTKLIINEPNVVKISMQGQESLQITGELQEESERPQASKEDIQTIVDKTGADEETARKTLEKNNFDLAETILELSE